jgi:hypothetical protein
MGFFKKAAVATAMATAVVAMVGQGGAFADTVSDAVVAVGTGTITPGLPTTGCAVQTAIDFNGTGAVVGDDGVTAPATVTFAGNSGSTCESLNSGQGSGTLGGTFTAAVSYQRTGPIVQVFGTGNIGGKPHTPIAAVCIFVPTSVNPVTTYALVCAAALSSTGD